jgi:hypothetical protein
MYRMSTQHPEQTVGCQTFMMSRGLVVDMSESGRK